MGPRSCLQPRGPGLMLKAGACRTGSLGWALKGNRIFSGRGCSDPGNCRNQGLEKRTVYHQQGWVSRRGRQWVEVRVWGVQILFVGTREHLLCLKPGTGARGKFHSLVQQLSGQEGGEVEDQGQRMVACHLGEQTWSQCFVNSQICLMLARPL